MGGGGGEGEWRREQAKGAYRGTAKMRLYLSDGQVRRERYISSGKYGKGGRW